MSSHFSLLENKKNTHIYILCLLQPIASPLSPRGHASPPPPPKESSFKRKGSFVSYVFSPCPPSRK